MLVNINYLNEIAQKTTFNRDNLEKVFRLVNILQYFNDSEYLKDKVVLKGGTAINLCYFDLLRLSVDIDLDLTENISKENIEQYKNDVKNYILSYMLKNGYILKPRSKEHYALQSLSFGYTNAVGNKDNLKIEINFLSRCHILPLEYREINIDGIIQNIKILTLNMHELFASKINALISRGTPRDVFDVYFMIDKLPYMNMEVLKKCLIFYNMVGGDQSVDNISYEVLESLNYYKFKTQLKPLLKKSDKFNIEEAKKKVIEFVRNLLVFDDSEVEFIELFKQRIYKPELLFNEETILENIKNHPMALWRCKE